MLQVLSATHRLPSFSPRLACLLLVAPAAVLATPANHKAAANHYEHFLSEALNHCSLCHLPSDNHAPVDSSAA